VSAELEAARFPRATVVLEAVRVAEVLRAGAAELDALAGAAKRWGSGWLASRLARPTVTR
jgi:hypothetical protein